MTHTLWCRLLMLLARRRVCTCGSTPPRSKKQQWRDFCRGKPRERFRRLP